MNRNIENLLSLSLRVPEMDRAKNPELESGYNLDADSWEVIIKYNGNVLQYNSETVRIEVLLNGYAIALVQENELEDFLSHKEIEYAEKPKQFYFND